MHVRTVANGLVFVVILIAGFTPVALVWFFFRNSIGKFMRDNPIGGPILFVAGIMALVLLGFFVLWHIANYLYNRETPALPRKVLGRPRKN